ncbi:MAG TPA: DUF5320 domain-containing protein [Firmicutes bacterium]|nr:DUF5320 domain-containing protein [Candidatus Fermentithermobacillaceae bacterium]
MPGFDGTGPRGRGPFTGKGQGFCAIRVPGAVNDSASGSSVRSRAGIALRRAGRLGMGIGLGLGLGRRRRRGNKSGLLGRQR